MLDNLLDIEVAYSLLRGGAEDNEKDPIDINYEKLKTKIEVGVPLSASKGRRHCGAGSELYCTAALMFMALCAGGG